MVRNLFPLALQGIRRKKRSSRLVFSVLLISFAFTILSISLVTSINSTNRKLRHDTYGEWYSAIPDATPEDEAWLREQPWVNDIGTVWVCGDIFLPDGPGTIGVVDDVFIDMGHLRLDQGRWPEADNEIAIEARTLSLLDYEQELGQEISLSLGGSPLAEEKVFTICGIIHEYANIWNLRTSSRTYRPPSVVLSPDYMETKAAGMEPPRQLYITVDKEDQETALPELLSYMQSSRQETVGDTPMESRSLCFNYLSSNDANDQTESYFTKMICGVAMIAVLCAYIMQLPTEVRSYATLRSIGITKPQLAALLLTETVLLTLPAIVLGIPLGAGLVWLALKFVMYSGNVAIQVEIPVGTILPVILLMLLMVLLSRFIVFLVTIRTPLVGKFRLSGAKARRNRRFRGVLIGLLLICYGIVMVHTIMISTPDLYHRKRLLTIPGFMIQAHLDELIYEQEAELVRQIPGVTGVDGISRWEGMEAELSFEGFQELVQILPVDDKAWAETLHLGRDQEAFRNGELCVIYIPDDGGTYVLPQEEVSVSLTSPTGKILAASPSTPVKILRRTIGLISRTVVIRPYAIICSHSYLEGLISSIEPGIHWNEFASGHEYGYQELFVSVDMQGKSLDTEKVIANLCEDYHRNYRNNYDKNYYELQNVEQDLVLLCAGGVSIGLVLLFVLASAISLETEQEKLRYGTLRVLGMSRRQMRRAVTGKICWRALMPLVVGWGVEILANLTPSTLEKNHMEAFHHHLKFIANINNMPIAIGVTVFVVVTLALVCLLGKRELWRGENIKQV